MSVVVVAAIQPNPGAESVVREAVLAAVPKVHAEQGCVKYALHEAVDGSGSLTLIERWESLEALGAHGGGAVFAELAAALEGQLSVPMDAKVLEPVAAGAADKGMI